MTLEETTQGVLAATAAADPAGIGEALEARAAAVQELAGEEPTEELARRISDAIEAGNIAAAALRGLKLRIGSERARLKQMRSFVENLSARPRPHLDYRG